MPVCHSTGLYARERASRRIFHSRSFQHAGRQVTPAIVFARAFTSAMPSSPRGCFRFSAAPGRPETIFSQPRRRRCCFRLAFFFADAAATFAAEGRYTRRRSVAAEYRPHASLRMQPCLRLYICTHIRADIRYVCATDIIFEMNILFIEEVFTFTSEATLPGFQDDAVSVISFSAF